MGRVIKTLMVIALISLVIPVDCVQLKSRDEALQGQKAVGLQGNNEAEVEIQQEYATLNSEMPGQITLAELKASQDIDNMSISEIIAQRFKKSAVVTEVKTPKEVAEIIIKAPEEANLVQNVEGDKDKQQEYQKKIEDIETNRMYAWSDMAKVKKDLWNKLHAVKELIGKGATNLAQLFSSGGQHLYHMPSRIQKHLSNMYASVKPEQPIMLGQMSSLLSETAKTKDGLKSIVPSPKHVNTKGTMLLYFCIITVLMCFCLGRCLVVPLSQASRFELNSRKHVKKLDKNGFIQQEVIA